MYAISLGLALTPICFSTVSAQERCKVSEEATAAKSNYTQQHVLDVGDISGHQIRVFELHRTYPNDKPNCENLKRTESPEVIPTTSIAMAEPGDTTLPRSKMATRSFLNLMERAKPRSPLMVQRKAPSQVSPDTSAEPENTRVFAAS
jgi:hypothetical protein